VSLRVQACRSCSAPIVWALTERGKRMPVDAEPSADGNIVLIAPDDPRDEPVARIAGLADRTEERHRSHFVTCPQASSWRRNV
jgi:hypothetical protein